MANIYTIIQLSVVMIYSIFKCYVEQYYPWQSIFTPSFIKKNFNTTRLVYKTKYDLKLNFIKKQVCTPTIFIKEKIVIKARRPTISKKKKEQTCLKLIQPK